MFLFDSLSPVELAGVPSNAMADLSKLGLSREHAERRLRSIGGYDARIIASGDAEKIDKLARIKRRQETDDDLSDVVMVQMGNWTEPLNLAWFQRDTGWEVRGRGQVIAHSQHDWAHCSLDGACLMGNGQPALIECKHVTGFQKLRVVLQTYWPQIQHSLWVLDWDHAFLSAFWGSHHYVRQYIEFDPLYMAGLAREEEKFWAGVQDGRSFIPEPLPPMNLKLEEMVEVDMTEVSNEIDPVKVAAWSSAAATWIANNEAAKQLETAKTTIRKLIPDGVKTAYGAGVQAKLARNGRMTITERVEPIAEPPQPEETTL